MQKQECQWQEIGTSPVFREMIKKIPDGAGCVMLDAGYGAHENYRMIRNMGRRPVICTRKNHIVKGFGPRAEMLRWQEKNPEEFEKIVPPMQHSGISILVIQAQVYCGCSSKENGNTKIAVNF